MVNSAISQMVQNRPTINRRIISPARQGSPSAIGVHLDVVVEGVVDQHPLLAGAVPSSRLDGMQYHGILPSVYAEDIDDSIPFDAEIDIVSIVVEDRGFSSYIAIEFNVIP